MTGPECRAARGPLATSTRGLGRFMGVKGPSTPQEWMDRGPSPPAAKLIRLMLALGLTCADVDRLIAEHERDAA